MAKKSLELKYSITGWIFVIPASLLIVLTKFYPMLRAFILSLHSGVGNNLRFSGLRNYIRLFQDGAFLISVRNVLIYLIVQVPIMLILALIFASMLNDKTLKFKGVFRTMIFAPCATALISAALIFRSLFSLDGLVNKLLIFTGIFSSPINFLQDPIWAKIIIIITITWRWTGYNTVFYMAGLQNIDSSIYEAARIDGASPLQSFIKITMPLLKPVILLTAITSTNGTLQLFDEVRNLTQGGPGNETLTISQYIYRLSFEFTPQFGYAAAVSFVILFLVAVLSLIQIKVGDKE